ALALRLRALAKAGTVVLLATHDVDLADQVLDRAMVLQNGRLIDVVSGAGWRQAYRAAIGREHKGNVPPNRVSNLPEGSPPRGPQPRDDRHDAVLRSLCGAGVRIRSGEGRPCR